MRTGLVHCCEVQRSAQQVAGLVRSLVPEQDGFLQHVIFCSGLKEYGKLWDCESGYGLGKLYAVLIALLPTPSMS